MVSIGSARVSFEYRWKRLDIVMLAGLQMGFWAIWARVSFKKRAARLFGNIIAIRDRFVPYLLMMFRATCSRNVFMLGLFFDVWGFCPLFRSADGLIAITPRFRLMGVIFLGFHRVSHTRGSL